MFRQLLNFEVSYQLKQRALPIFALIFFLYGVLAGSQGFAPANVNFNAGYQINFYTGLFTLGSVFIIIFFSVSGMLRDRQYHMDSLIYSTAIKKNQFFWSRFLGVFIFSLLAFTPMMIGLLTGFSFSSLDPERLSAFNYINYLRPWIFIVVPNVFFCSTIIFAVSTITKSNIATYVSSVFIYMLYMISGIFMNSPLMAQSVPASPEAMALAALADPFGISAFYEQTQFWTPFQKNTQILSFSGLYMWNRILWLVISFGVLLTTYRLFSFRKANQKVNKSENGNEEIVNPVYYSTVRPNQSFQSQLNAFYSLLKVELTGVLKSLPFVGVMIIWVIIVFSSIYSRIYEGGAYGDSLYPLTNLLVELIIDPLTLLVIIPILFYSGEIVWRERNMNINGIVDATPVANWAFFLSKLVALMLLPVLFIITGIVLAICFQTVSGYFNFEMGQYLNLFYHNGIQFFVFCIIAIFIQSIVRNKYFGMGIAGIIILGSFLSPYIGIEHPMLRIGYFPKLGYSNMTGYYGETLLFNHLVFYWIGLGGILSLFSFKLWQRGINENLIPQLKTLLLNWKRWEYAVMATFVILFVVSGTIIFYNNNIVNDYTTSSENLDFREEYERKFKQYDSLDRLYWVKMKTKIDLYPNEKKYVVKADYLLKNKSDSAIHQLFITARIPLSSIILENAVILSQDTVFDTYLFQFLDPVLPNQEVKFSYELTQKSKGYETNQQIQPNGTYVTHRNFEPYLKYRSGLEISNKHERQKRGLPELKEEVITDAHLGLEGVKFGRVDYETVISTQEDEIAIGTGALVKQWTVNGRNYYHYKSIGKVLPTMAYFSARYATQKEVHNGVNIEQYYHSDHVANVDSIGVFIRQTLDYCIANFGDYPYDHLRIAEIPSQWQFGGFAHPGVISMVEDNLYLIDTRDAGDFNLVAKRTIHEVAHQWWGHVLVPKIVEGGSIFVEGFAKYTEAVVMQKMYGKRAIWQLSLTANRRYFPGRAFSSETEPPLYLEDGQGYLSYGKIYTVMLALRELIGEEKVNRVLRSLTDRYRDSVEGSVYSLEFLDEIYQISPASQHILIDDWFKRVITYDLSASEASYKQLDNGKYEVIVKVNAKRFETNERGEELAIYINEPISIGLFSMHPGEVSDDSSILYLKPHQIIKEKMEFHIIVNKLPEYVSIDPFGTRSDPDMNNNVIRL